MAEKALVGRRALVTGASRGIGLHIARRLAEAGAHVALSARSHDLLKEAAQRIQAGTGPAAVVVADLADEGSGTRLVQQAVEHLGGLDVIVNNAGIGGPARFEELTPAHWNSVMRVNFGAVAEICAAAAPHLRAAGGGSIVNVASVAGQRAHPAAPHYGVTKAAVIALTRTLAVHWAAEGIRVNALCPGYARTDLNRAWWDDPEVSQAVVERVPMGRWAKAEEMADPAVFLASDASAFMTGQTLVIDGGLLAR